MNQRFYALLNECSTLVRIGEVVREESIGQLHVTTIDALPAESDLKPNLEIVDMILVKVAVDRAAAEARRDEFVRLIEPMRAELEPGPSFIAIGASVGDQGVAFQMMAVGEVLKLWKVITPKTLGIDDAARATEMAGVGYVMISGYRRENEDDLAQTEREASDV